MRWPKCLFVIFSHITLILADQDYVENILTITTCDNIFKDPHKFGDEYDTMFKGMANPQILIDTFKPINSKLKHKIPCQNIIFHAENTTDIDMADQYQISTRKPTSLVLAIVNNPIKLKNWKIKDLRIVSKGIDTLVTSYSSLQDPHWRQLRVVFFYWNPYISRNKDGSMQGVFYNTWSLMGDQIGFEMTFENEKSYGHMYSRITNETADLALPKDSLYGSMLEIADFTYPAYFERFKFYNAKPGPVTPILTLVYPFNTSVWIALLIAGLFALASIYLINIKIEVTLFDSVQILISSIVNDSAADRLKVLNRNWYGYLVLFIWFMCGFLLMAAYSSNLLASLMIVAKTTPDNTFEDLVRNKRTLGVLSNSFIGQWLKTSPREIVRRAEKECATGRGGYYNMGYVGITPPKLTPKLESGEASSIIMESIFHNLEMKYRLGTDVLMESYSTFYMRLGHPLRPQIDMVMERLFVSGILDHIRRIEEWVKTKRNLRDYYRNKSIRADIKPKISIKHLAALWIIQGFGVAIALVVFIKEYRQRSSRRI